MKLYSYFFCGEKLEEKAFEAKECSKTYTALERGVGCIYNGMRINKESIGNLIEHSNTIVFLEESRNAAIEAFISREKRRADFAKRNLDRAQENIAHLEKLK